MQDKEFDRLFNSKLSDLEMEPSPMVWANIATELDVKKGKRGIAVYLSIAASVIVLVSAGLLFFNRTEKLYLRPTKEAMANKAKVIPKTVGSGTITEPVTDQPIEQVVVKIKAVGSKPMQKTTIKAVKKATAVVPQMSVPEPVEQQVIAAIKPKEQERPAMTVPDIGTALTVKTLSTEPQVIESVTTVTTIEEPAKAPSKKRGIRSLGGLINAIVAKVDKRQDKLIEFTEDEDEGSNLTGVNLGLLKIKKQ